MQQIDLFTSEGLTEPYVQKNPMIRGYGPDPEGRKCRNCAHFGHVQYANKYYKCKLRGTSGKSTDHNYYWSACTKFKEGTA